jgi:uncharacterized protein YlaN (UPF0358 family)
MALTLRLLLPDRLAHLNTEQQLEHIQNTLKIQLQNLTIPNQYEFHGKAGAL